MTAYRRKQLAFGVFGREGLSDPLSSVRGVRMTNGSRSGSRSRSAQSRRDVGPAPVLGAPSSSVSPVRAAGVVAAEALAQLRESVATLADLASDGSLAGIPAAALVELAEGVHRCHDRLGAVAVVATRTVHVSDALSEGRQVSTSRWLQSRCGKSPAEARALVARAYDVSGRFARTEAAWLRGEISTGAAREITHGITQVVRGRSVHDSATIAAQAQETLLQVARTGTVADVATTVRHLRFVLDPDGASQAQVDAYDDQQLVLRDVGTMVVLTAYLSQETAAKVRTALEATVDGWYRAGSLAGEDIAPTGGADTDSRRRRYRRPHLLALALADLAERALDSGALGTRHGVRPHVTLTVDLDRLLAGWGGELAVPGGDPVVLPPETVRRIMCDADVHPVITTRGPGIGVDGDDTDDSDVVPVQGDRSGNGCDGRDSLRAGLRRGTTSVLWVGRTHRTVPPRLRRALEVRDEHCAFPDCRVGVARTVGHHVVPWEHQGTTDPANTVLLCHQHHHAVHEGGWVVTAVDGLDPLTHGYWQFTPPARRHRP